MNLHLQAAISSIWIKVNAAMEKEKRRVHSKRSKLNKPRDGAAKSAGAIGRDEHGEELRAQHPAAHACNEG
jgi:hypothetical protein